MTGFAQVNVECGDAVGRVVEYTPPEDLGEAALLTFTTPHTGEIGPTGCSVSSTMLPEQPALFFFEFKNVSKGRAMVSPDEVFPPTLFFGDKTEEVLLVRITNIPVIERDDSCGCFTGGSLPDFGHPYGP